VGPVGRQGATESPATTGTRTRSKPHRGANAHTVASITLPSAPPHATLFPVEMGGRVAGAYGVRVLGLEDTTRLPDAPESWPEWDVACEVGPDGHRQLFIDDDAAFLRLGDGTEIELMRAGSGGRASIRLSGPVHPADLAHPYLAPLGILAAHWSSRVPIHAGAFIVDGGAWLIPATPGSGKTTTLAAVAQAGGVVVADDLAVISAELDVFCGPRFVDLREDASRALAAGTYIGMLGVRERWRMDLGPAPSQVPLAGIVIPAWGEASMERLSMAERFRLLIPHIAIRRPGGWADLLMEVLTSVPVIQWTRPAGIGGLPHQAAQLMDDLTSVPA
jgi:hypothetical protein